MCFKIVPNGGLVIGVVDNKGNLTGKDIVFLYPDMKTALMGQFHEG